MPKKKTSTRKKPMNYVGPESPAIEYADFVKLSTSSNGVLFSFGQTHPERQGITITYEVLLPVPVSYSLRDILIEQLEALAQRMKEQIETSEK